MQIDKKVERAIKVMAQQVVINALMDYTKDAWENYPEIGEFDWACIVDFAFESLPKPSVASIRASYELLESRANDDD